jgi:DNA polymerase-1
MANKKRETLVLLDTHAIIHRAYHAIPELTSPAGEPVGAVYGLCTMLMKIVKELTPDHIIAAYDLPGPTHRHEVYKEYKAKRPEIDDALVTQINRSRDMLAAFGIPLYEAPGFEADDVIGTIAKEAKKNFNVIIASGDMDTLQLVDDEKVRVYTLRKGIQDTVLYDEKAVLARFGFLPERIPDYKGFAGDPSDNIIGISGIGEKTATNLIVTFGSMDGVYKALKKSEDALLKAGIKGKAAELIKMHEDEAEFSKVLATIRTDAPVAFKEPVKTFAETLDVEKVTALMTELGFRSLVPRVRGLTGEEPSKVKAEEGETPLKSSLFPTTVSPEDEAAFKEARVMLWLTQSELTNPTLEDVLNITKSKTVSEAHEKLSVLIKKEKLERVWNDIEKPLIPVIDAINAHGVMIDLEYLKELSKEYHKELDTLAAKIFKEAGEEFNINSPKQLGTVLFEKMGLGKQSGKRQKKTATGQLSTKESELAKLKGEHVIIDSILAHRELQKLLSTYIDAIPPLLKDDGRLHTTFVQTGAATGRLSSQNPNLQNIPIKTELGRRIRNAFIAPPGKTLIAFDYSQIELRLAAFLSGDEKLSDIFKRGEDVHSAVAAEVFSVPQSEVTYDMRRSAKVINFGILYGMGVNALRESLGTDRAEAQAFYNRYFETFSTLAEYMQKTRASAARLGYTETYFGRKRYFPGIRSKIPFVRASAERMAINAPLQGTQSDIIKIAMTRIHGVLNEKYEGRGAIVLQIHDELIFEVPETDASNVAADIRIAMEQVLSKEELHGIPILVSGEAGANWGELKPL